jgi:cyclin D1/2/4
MSSVTAFSYVDYFFHKLGISNTLLRALLSRVSDIILATARETIFLEYQPSIVAAAATICSLEEVTALKAADLHGVFADLSVDMVRIITACHLLQRQSLVQFLVFWIAES